jgi:pyridoxine 5-phosphate synthase
MLLGVNIDHIAVLREARCIGDPSPLDALGICKRAGADQITIHLREDRRHIQDADAFAMMELTPLPVNLECAIDEAMVEIACQLKPHRVTFVPEKREEVTTEGGLDVMAHKERLQRAIESVQAHDIEVSLFIDPTSEAVTASKELGVTWVEFHTGHYANIYAMLNTNLSKTHHTIPSLDVPRSELKEMLKRELKILKHVSHQAHTLGLRVAAGHGLNYQNVGVIANIAHIEELNIGQSIIARSVFTGLEEAVVEMKKAMQKLVGLL